VDEDFSRLDGVHVLVVVQIPTIAMTYDHSEQAEFWAAGVADVLVTPLDAMALCRVVRRLVTQN